MSDLRVIGVSGKAETGKDYIANAILAPLGFKPWAMADHMKIWLVGRGQFTYEEVFETKPEHVRRELQLEGTERGRDLFGADVWTTTNAAWLRRLHERWGQSMFMFTDIRFENEVQFVQQLGGKVIRIVAPERAQHNRLSERDRAHSSETALDEYQGFDAYIYNDPSDLDLRLSDLDLRLSDLDLRLQMNGILREFGWHDLIQTLTKHALLGTDS